MNLSNLEQIEEKHNQLKQCTFLIVKRIRNHTTFHMNLLTDLMNGCLVTSSEAAEKNLSEHLS